MQNKKISVQSIIFGQMRHRYEMVDYQKLSTNQKSYGIIDSIFPHQLFKMEKGHGFAGQRAGAVAISERVAREAGVPKMDIAELVAIYGYTKTGLKEVLLKVKKKNFSICVIGYGGTGTNFLHWLSQMSVWTNTNKLFTDLVVSDKDDFDSINLLRVPFLLPEINSTMTKKVLFWNDYAGLGRDKLKMTENINANNLYKNHIHYGAPGLETRKMLVDMNVPFIAATHRDNACGLMLNPELDTELMVETYGKIALTPFFLNHIKMTLSFMEYLAKDETTPESLKGKEESILKYDFGEENKDLIKNGGRFNGRTVYPVMATDQNTIDIDTGE